MDIKRSFAVGFLLVTPVLANCTGKTDSQVAPAQTPAAQAAAKLTADDLKKLRWIEGTWRGTGEGVQPFYERYRFENDTTLAIDTFADEQLTKVTDTTRYELKNGEMGGGNEGFRWVAGALDDKSITFVPVAKARNSFRWETVDKDSWKAVLNWPATAERPARERVYKMERWPKP